MEHITYEDFNKMVKNVNQNFNNLNESIRILQANAEKQTNELKNKLLFHSSLIRDLSLKNAELSKQLAVCSKELAVLKENIGKGKTAADSLAQLDLQKDIKIVESYKDKFIESISHIKCCQWLIELESQWIDGILPNGEELLKNISEKLRNREAIELGNFVELLNWYTVYYGFKLEFDTVVSSIRLYNYSYDDVKSDIDTIIGNLKNKCGKFIEPKIGNKAQNNLIGLRENIVAKILDKAKSIDMSDRDSIAALLNIEIIYPTAKKDIYKESIHYIVMKDVFDSNLDDNVIFNVKSLGYRDLLLDGKIVKSKVLVNKG